MSVKLIVVALLAAAAAANDAAKKNIVTTTYCGDSKDGAECNCPSPVIKNYTVGDCTKGDSDVYWKVGGCTPDTDTAIILKGYHNDSCTAHKETIPTACTPVLYRQATCATSGSNGDTTTTVKLYTSCSSNKCSADNGSCDSIVTFTVKENAASPKCAKFGDAYLKLVVTDLQNKCTSSDVGATIDFKEYTSEEACNDDMDTAKGTAFNVEKACTASYYIQGTCAPTENKASYKVCAAKKGASDAAEHCASENTACGEATTFKFGEEKMVDNGYWVIDSCSASEALTFKVYAGWAKYQTKCTAFGENARAMATCTAPSSDNNSSDNNDSGSNSSDNNDSGSNSSDNNDSGSNSSDNSGGIIAPALSTGVLALVLCLLACTY